MHTHNYYPEIEADRILAAIVRDDRPHYSDEALDRKAKVDRLRGRQLAAAALGKCEAAVILRRQTMRRVLASSKLTGRQLEVLAAKLSGDGWLEIGRRFGYSRQAAQGIFKQAIGKVRRAWRAYPFAGLDEVYRQEVSRYGPRRH